MAQTDKPNTDGQGDSMTKSTQRADSVKILHTGENESFNVCQMDSSTYTIKAKKTKTLEYSTHQGLAPPRNTLFNVDLPHRTHLLLAL